MFDRFSFLTPEPILRGPAVYLRQPAMGDWSAWAELRGRSRAFLTPWEPVWAADALNRAAYRRRLRRYAEESRAGIGQSFLIFRNEDDALVGGLTLSNIRRGVAWSATLGYWMGRPHAGRGYMKQAVALTAEHVFNDLRMHRLEAACLPRNAASRGVLTGCGFTEEGLARQYLCINGIWEDHVLYALLAADARPDPRAMKTVSAAEASGFARHLDLES